MSVRNCVSMIGCGICVCVCVCVSHEVCVCVSHEVCVCVCVCVLDTVVSGCAAGMAHHASPVPPAGGLMRVYDYGC